MSTVVWYPPERTRRSGKESSGIAYGLPNGYSDCKSSAVLISNSASVYQLIEPSSEHISMSLDLILAQSVSRFEKDSLNLERKSYALSLGVLLLKKC